MQLKSEKATAMVRWDAASNSQGESLLPRHYKGGSWQRNVLPRYDYYNLYLDYKLVSATSDRISSFSVMPVLRCLRKRHTELRSDSIYFTKSYDNPSHTLLHKHSSPECVFGTLNYKDLLFLTLIHGPQ